MTVGPSLAASLEPLAYRRNLDELFSYQPRFFSLFLQLRSL